MKTLYDLLGALPHDDAEALRSAFRKAVKSAHPDIWPGDPEAALKFREIVRANEILGDAELRAAYDELLEHARREQLSASRYAIAARIHRLASGVIALAGAAAVTVGGYAVFLYMSAGPVATANRFDFAMRAVAEIASLNRAAPTDPAGRGAPIAEPAKEAPDRTITASAAAPQADKESIPAAEPAASEAGFLQARGNSANGSGADRAIADLDQAIHFDPKFSVASADHGPASYRQQKFERAFADLAPVKQIRKTSHTKDTPALVRKRHPDTARMAPQALRERQHRAALQGSSQEESLH